MSASVAPALLVDGRPFDRTLADQYGFGQHDVTRLVTDGMLRQVPRGVCVDARVPDDPASRAACRGYGCRPARPSSA